MQAIGRRSVLAIVIATLSLMVSGGRRRGTGSRAGWRPSARPSRCACPPPRSPPWRPSIQSTFAGMYAFSRMICWKAAAPGQRGGDIAAEYIATQFAEYGLKPAGDNGSYLQKVPLVGITTLPETQFSLLPKQGAAMNLKPLDEYVAYDQTQQSQSDVDADIVYVGYGIEAPEYNWDDYKGVDVRGKVLLMLVNEPPSDDPKFFKGKALTYYGRWTYKYEEAARKGAVGVILIHREDMASYPWEVVRNSNSGEKSYLKLEGPALKVASWVQLDVAKKLAAGSGMDLDKMMADARTRDFHPVNLGAKLKAHMVSKVRNFESNNVLAMLPGSNRNLKDEAVMYTAHYDHLGIRPDMPGDNIYNGAADNATGCGILLELARAFSVAKERPARSIIFASVTAEEQGLLGSEYLGKHPPIPAGKIALDLNYDDVQPLGAPGRSRSLRRGTHDVLSLGAGDGERIPAGDPSRCAPRGRPLLPLRPFQSGARGHSIVLDQRRHEVQRSRRGLGHGAG